MVLELLNSLNSGLVLQKFKAVFEEGEFLATSIDVPHASLNVLMNLIHSFRILVILASFLLLDRVFDLLLPALLTSLLWISHL